MNAFLRVFTVILLAWTCQLPAAYLEGEGERTADELRRPAPPQHVPPPVVPPKHDALSTLIQGLRVGGAYRRQGLTVYPLVTARPVRQDDIVTFDEARRRGWITIAERDKATVAELDIINSGPRHVLLLSGAIIVGGKQNRMVREDILLPPRNRPIPLNVYCIEQERWSGDTTALAPAGSVAHPKLRKAAAAKSAQDAIWREVSEQNARAGVASKTSDYQTIYRDRKVAGRLNEIATGFRRQRPARTVGIAVASHGRIIAVDVFSDPDLFDDACDALLRGYAVQAPNDDRPEPRRRRHPPRITSADIEQFLNRTLRARRTALKTPGAGQALHLSGALNGSALIWRNDVVHANLWP